MRTIARGIGTLSLVLTVAIIFFSGLLATSPARAQGAGCNAVQREMAYGEAAIQDAKSRAGFLEAAKQYRAAIKKAPNCAAAHFNLGVAYEKAGRLSSAKVAFETYLKLAPNAKDAARVRKSIFKLEYRIKRARAARARRTVTARRTSPRRRPKPKQKALNLTGTWLERRSVSNDSDAPVVVWEWRIIAVGNSIEITHVRYRFASGSTWRKIPNPNRFKGTINGRKINGIVRLDWSSHINMGIIQRAFTGTVGQNGSTIKLSYTGVEAKYPNTSTPRHRVTGYRNVRMDRTLIKK